ncbi:hypothetical protein GGP86_002731 [Salinibacter ruber]|uniref:hypothetical protein n=1 Tax=Salinibacter ruber TaxID=146919 RepID=UPI0021671EA3|nr:hypothetical protein [Salinibacter ruber]MCS3862942.1 hypothetical protein [Salinibacter ruber]
MNQLLAPILSSLVGGLLVAIPTLWKIYRSDRRQTARVASAFRGEISAILNLYRRREYLALHKERLREWEEKNDEVSFPSDYEERTRDRIYQSNASRIGLLPGPIPGKIATFYTLLDGIHEDLAKMSRGALKSVPREAKIAYYRQFVSIMEEMISLAEELEGELSDHAGM